jgi:mannose-6-phosphate isomerase-like protein (cupin superfamily)
LALVPERAARYHRQINQSTATRGRFAMDAFTLDELAERSRASGSRFHEFLRVDALSCGMYILPGGGVDDQVPHREDEIYVVVKGSGTITVAGESRPIGPGSVVFVAADVEHRFSDFADDLEILVLFAPAYSGRPG